jgi:hypothetical protein
MRFPARTLARSSALSLALATAVSGVACVGSISGSGDKGPSGPDTGKPNNPPVTGQPDPGKPPANPPTVAVGQCTESTLAKPRAWRLTHDQVRNSLRDSFGFVPPTVNSFPAEARIDSSNSRNGFANRSDELKISALLADSYFKASEELATEVVSKGATFGLTCPTTGLASGDCLSKFLGTFGTKMWRRPLAPTEVTALSNLFKTAAGQGDGPEGGLKTVVQAMFLSPNFLYRSEIGHTTEAGKVTYLTDHELASALSYALWDTAPDAQLLDLAGQGKLRDRAVLLEQAKRLIGTTDRVAPAMHSFFEQWLRTDDVPEREKELSTFSLGTPEVAKDISEETRKLVSSIFFEPGGDKSFKTLFTAGYGFVNARTAPLYGIQGVTGDTLVKKDTNPAQRRGLLTQASFMWGHSNPDGTHPVERGRYFREEILCEGVPDPPPTVLIDPQFGNATLTKREQLEIHRKEAACAACHALFDGFGLAMENYDAIGRYRTEEAVMGGTKPIDPTGSVLLPGDSSPTVFKNYLELVDQLASKPNVYACFASQFLDYSTGRKPGEINDCERKLITDEFTKSGYKIDALVLGVVSSPSFMARKN